MPFLLRKPSTQAIERKLAALESPFSYAEVGGTHDPDEATLATAYRNLDGYEVRLGDGEATFHRAKETIRTWRHFPAWVRIIYPYPSIEANRPVAVVVRVLGLYSLNFTRIVYIIDEDRRFGFAYGTTAHHEEIGEERFLVEWREDGVWYTIFAFSSPQTFLAKLGYPVARRMQRRFGRDSLAAMREGIRDDDQT